MSRALKAIFSLLTLGAMLSGISAWAQYTTPGGDRTQGTNYNSNQPPANNTQNTATTNTFNPQTGTWGNSPVPSTGNSFNSQTGTWSTTTGANGSPINIFTPNQVPSGSTASNFSNTSTNSHNTGPRVIPNVAIKPRPSIYSRVFTKPRP